MKWLIFPVGLLLGLLAPLACHSQKFPNKPIRIVVPFTAGGTVDGVARILQRPLTESFGQPVIVDNRAGAGGRMGTDLVAKSAPSDSFCASETGTAQPPSAKAASWRAAWSRRACGLLP